MGAITSRLGLVGAKTTIRGVVFERVGRGGREGVLRRARGRRRSGNDSVRDGCAGSVESERLVDSRPCAGCRSAAPGCQQSAWKSSCGAGSGRLTVRQQTRAGWRARRPFRRQRVLGPLRAATAPLTETPATPGGRPDEPRRPTIPPTLAAQSPHWHSQTARLAREQSSRGEVTGRNGRSAAWATEAETRSAARGPRANGEIRTEGGPPRGTPR